MFSTFTTKDGTLVLRTEDIRRIEDRGGTCMVAWVETERDDSPQTRPVIGTAAENLDRLIADDRRRSAEYAAMQQRISQGLSPLAVERGKAGRG